ncbi:MAG: hypothetical protein DYG98_10665 [Haliscomenobacteraceae bacterium CHB4]|nr:hypothetical protein [Haliscomenobacteraceae bacterium CHB4]
MKTKLLLCYTFPCTLISCSMESQLSNVKSQISKSQMNFQFFTFQKNPTFGALNQLAVDSWQSDFRPIPKSPNLPSHQLTN